MKRKPASKIICSLVCYTLASLAMVNDAKADGTEQLGPPSIPIAQGSHIVVEGIGLENTQPGDIYIEIPADVAIAQVLLYWTGRPIYTDWGEEDTVLVNGMYITGPRIGGPTPELGYPSLTYRADITEMSFGQSWIVAGQINVLSVSWLDFVHANDGAAVVVILDDGSMTEIQIMDGNDFAYQPYEQYDDPSVPIDFKTVPIDFPFEPSANPRVGTMWLIVSDIAVPRPAVVDITVDGVTTRLYDVLLNNEGNYLDVVELEVPVPAGAANVTVQLFSIDDGSGLQPASLAWSFVSWALPEPYTPPQVCTYTQGFWKNHPDDWPVDELSIYSNDEALELLRTPPKKGNAYIILAHQYIAAELNVLNGASVPSEVMNAGLKAQQLLEKYLDKGTISKKSSDRGVAIDLAGTLDDYNNGIIGPGHCD